MFNLQKGITSITRHKLKSVLTVLICALLVLFLFLFMGGLSANTRQLAALPDAMPVYARVSNLNGTFYDSLLVTDTRIRGLEASPHVTELSYTVQMWTASKRIAEEDVQYLKSGELNFPISLGINSLATYSAVSEEDVSFIDGYGPEVFEGEEPVCIVHNYEMKKNNLSPGDSIWFTLFYISYPNDTPAYDVKWLGEYEVKIVGSYTESPNTESTDRPPQVVFPIKWLWKLYEEKGVLFCASSARFRVADPLLLNDFKEEMNDLMLMSVISQAQHSQRGIALTVNDETFVRSASRLMDNIALMRAFTPFILAAVGLVGFVVSYLLLLGRRPEIAIMRSMGMSENHCLLLFFIENSVLCLIGCAFGIILAALLAEVSVFLAITVVALFFVCYMAGTVIALKLLCRFSVMAVLAALD